MSIKYWYGRANDVAQVVTSVAGGTFASLDTVFAEINHKRVTVQMVTDYATTDVVAALAAAINATDLTSDLAATDEIRVTAGQLIGEFKDVIASASASTITVKSRTLGVPFTVDFGKVSSAGTMGAASVDIEATGKNHFDNDNNWSGVAIPVDDDTIVFADNNVSVLYALNSPTVDLSFIRRNSYYGNIGLPAKNSTHTEYEYPEYRNTNLELPPTGTGSGDQYLVFGEQGGSYTPSGITRIDLSSASANTQKIVVHATQNASLTFGAAVQISGGNPLIVEAYAGSIDIGVALSGTPTAISGLTIGTADVRLGAKVTLNTSTTIVQLGGTLDAFEVIAGTSNTLNQYGGAARIDRGSLSSGTLNAANIYADANLSYNGLTITALDLYGTLDADQSSGFTVTDATFHDGYVINDVASNITWSGGAPAVPV